MYNKPDAVRRQNQADRMVRMLQIHQLTFRCQHTDAETVSRVAKKLNVSDRTVYRHIKVLRQAYSIMGDKLDPK